MACNLEGKAMELQPVQNFTHTVDWCMKIFRGTLDLKHNRAICQSHTLASQARGNNHGSAFMIMVREIAKQEMEQRKETGSHYLEVHGTSIL